MYLDFIVIEGGLLGLIINNVFIFEFLSLLILFLGYC